MTTPTPPQTITEFLVQMRDDAVKELQVFAANLTMSHGTMLGSGQEAMMAAARKAAVQDMIRAIRRSYGADNYRFDVTLYLSQRMAYNLRVNNYAHQAMGLGFGEIMDFMEANPDMPLD